MTEVSNGEVQTAAMDHYGLVAAICQDLKIAEKIDSRLSADPQRKVSPGTAVVAMIINGLGFTNRRLYLTHQFFESKPIARLLGQHLEAKDITDYTLGHALDDISECDASQLFAEVAFEIALENNVLGPNNHLDTTSMSVRIEALMMVMTLCLMVYNFGQYRIREQLKEQQITLPNQLGKEVGNPTLRWIFQLMEGIGVVYFYEALSTQHVREVITNLTHLRRKIISLFGETAERIYGLIPKNSLGGLGM
jgi:transposase